MCGTCKVLYYSYVVHIRCCIHIMSVCIKVLYIHDECGETPYLYIYIHIHITYIHIRCCIYRMSARRMCDTSHTWAHLGTLGLVGTAALYSWWVLQHCIGFDFTRLVWGRLRVHRAFIYSDWSVYWFGLCAVSICARMCVCVWICPCPYVCMSRRAKEWGYVLSANTYSCYIRVQTRRSTYTRCAHFSLDGYCSTVQGVLDWFEVDVGFTGEVGGWGRDPFSRNLMSPTPRRKWYSTTGRRAH